MDISEANELIDKYVDIRERVKSIIGTTPTKQKSINQIKSIDANLYAELKKQQDLCLNKFKYIVLTKTSKYKPFLNYDDLNQEGMQALLRAMNSYVPGKGNWFWWAHKYVDTKIARSANLHTVIKYPLRVAKAQPPKREPMMPLMVDYRNAAQELEDAQVYGKIIDSLKMLNTEQARMVKMFFGIEGEEPKSLMKISRCMKRPVEQCELEIGEAVKILQKNAKI